MTTPDNASRPDPTLVAVTAAIAGGAAAMAGPQDEGWETRFAASCADLLIQVLNPYSTASTLAKGMLSDTAKSFNAVRIVHLQLEQSSQRAKVTFATPTPEEPNHTDEVRTHRIDTKLGASQMSWLRANRDMLISGAVGLRVYLHVETIGPNKKVRVLNWVQFSG